jgi:acetyl-CoA carboxylase carboxyl transferase subunit alpha
MSETANDFTLDFEKPVRALEKQIEELQQAEEKSEIDISKEIKALQKKVNSLVKEIYSNLSTWERVQLSRHPKRPHTKDYIENLITDFHEVSGDRYFANDDAISAGFGYLDDQKVCVIGIEKGRKTKEKIRHNFGMPQPEGYRKAIRVMEMAARFNVPIITLVDTPGAYPGIGAEERGQSGAIADNLMRMFAIEVPILSLVIGEGGSGGALGIAIADKVFMMEYSIYSVISPESCASILWSDPKKAETAANSLNIGPSKALEMGVIDLIVDEPAGGAHKDVELCFDIVRKSLIKEIKSLTKISKKKLQENRFNKFRRIGNQTLNIDSNDELKVFE